MYLGLPCETLKEAIRPNRLDEFEATKKNCFAWDKWRNRTPGLFKLEFEGTRGIALCSKCYYMENEEKKNKVKMSSKGVSKRQNKLSWEKYEAALNGVVDRATNRGFRMIKGTMRTYLQKKLGLSAYYDKRWVLPDEIHTDASHGRFTDDSRTIHTDGIHRVSLTGGSLVLEGMTSSS